MGFETPSATTPGPIFASAVVVGKYYALAGLVVLVYDHVTTLDREVERIWSARFTAASLLFYLNRYLTLLLYIALTVGLFDPTWSPQTCQKFIIVPAVGAVITQGVISLVMLLRTYALWSRKRVILVLLVVAYVLLMAFSVRAFVSGRRYKPEQIIYPGCMLIIPGTLKTNPLVQAWFSLIVYDIMIVTLTLWRTISIHRLGGKMPLTTLLMRDGVAYFTAIALANLSYFFIYASAVPVNMTVAQSIASIVTSRLILNLRQGSRATTMVGSDDSLNFHRSGKSGVHLTQDGTPKLEAHGHLESQYDPRQDVSQGTWPSMVPRLSDASAVFVVPDVEVGPAVWPKDQGQATKSRPESHMQRDAWLEEMRQQQLSALRYEQRQGQLRQDRLAWMGNFGGPVDDAEEEGEVDEGEKVHHHYPLQHPFPQQQQDQRQRQPAQMGMREMGDFNSWDIDVERGTIGRRDDTHLHSGPHFHAAGRHSISSPTPSTPRTLVG